jgi:hypothetical protein
MPIVAVALAFALTGCAHGRIGELPAPGDQSSTAHIVIIRSGSIIGATNSYKLGVDGRDIYAIRVSERFAFDLVPGRHTFSVKCFGGWAPMWNTDLHALDVEARRTYFLLVRPSAVCAEIVPVDEQKGRELEAQTTPGP